MTSLVLTQKSPLVPFHTELTKYRPKFEAAPESFAYYSERAQELYKAITATISPAYRSKDITCTVGQEVFIEKTDRKYASLKSTSESASNWVTRILTFSDSGNEDAALKEISLAIIEFKSSANFSQLNDDLRRLDATKLPDIILIGLLRNTFSIRAHIQSWTGLLEKTESILRNQNKNTRSLLRGLKVI